MKRNPAQQQLFLAVCKLWAKSKGWPDNRWPKEAGYDAIQIGQYVVKLGAPLTFWTKVIAMVPPSAPFRWLTASPRPGEVGRLEDLWHRERDADYDAQRKSDEVMEQRGGFKSLGEIMREAERKG